MKDFIVNQPLQDRPVYGIGFNDEKTLIGHITCVTPEDWVMYWSDAKWRFIACLEGVPSSPAGTMEQAEGFVRDWVQDQAAVAA